MNLIKYLWKRDSTPAPPTFDKYRFPAGVDSLEASYVLWLYDKYGGSVRNSMLTDQELVWLYKLWGYGSRIEDILLEVEKK